MSQGSVQAQGEVQEEAIEDWIKTVFPMDEVVEIKKGSNGADCIHVVLEKGVSQRGSIYYESKNTKSFNDKWVDKLKTDMQEKNIDIGVIVTKTLPKEMKRMGLYKGIYVCTLEEFKGLCVFLRDFVLQFGKQQAVLKNKGDKKERLYSYITSKEFATRLERISEIFKNMTLSLEKEKKQFIIGYERRRAEIDTLRNNIFSFSGRISGISGTPILEEGAEKLETENSLKLIGMFKNS